MIDKSVIVTGASSGLGAHVTRRLVAEGARVLAAARRVGRLQALAEEVAAPPAGSSSPKPTSPEPRTPRGWRGWRLRPSAASTPW
jgi:NAD(P)-dependent dehydrogenase (short-subunit alcohol dehydrogenase family)